MQQNVTKISFKGFRLGYATKSILTKQKASEMQDKKTTPASMSLFTNYIQNQNKCKQTNKGA